MKQLIVIFTLVLVVSAFCIGCRTKYIPVEIKITDSTVVHDTTFNERLIPYRDSISIKDTFSFLTNPYAYSWAVWDNGILHHSLGIWPGAVLVVRVPYYTERIKRIEVPVPYPEEKIIQVEKELNWWQRLRIWIGNIVLLGIGIYGVIWLIKRKI